LLAEYYVEILAGAGIDTKVVPGTWDGAVTDLVGEI
jgi:uncharacterized membrane protein